MDQDVNRRRFLKNSALGFGGFLAFGPSVKDFETQLVDLNEVYKLSLQPNSWNRILQEDHGARRFSSFRYVPHIDRFLLWGFHGYIADGYNDQNDPWTDNKEYDIVALNPKEGRWENHLPQNKQDEWSKKLPPMHMTSRYQGITPGYYPPQLKEQEGVVRPDLNIVGDQVAYDSKRRRMVYFTGGRTFAYMVEERRWLAIDGKIAPPPVSFGALCYDPFKDRIILFGGGHIAETGPDGRLVGYTGVWSFDCESGQWSRLNTHGNPPPRMCTRLVCDTRNKVMMVFGGDSQTHWLEDTWILDLNNDAWRKSKSQTSPAARAGHFTVYDPITGLIIAGGGYNHKDLADMWGYDAAKDSWTRLQGETPVGWYVTADIIPEKGIIVLTTSTKTEGDATGCNEIYPVRTTWAYLIKEQGLTDKAAETAPRGAISKRSFDKTSIQPNPIRRSEQMKRIQNMPLNQWVYFSNPARVASIRTWGACAFDTDKGRIIYWGGGHCGYGGNDYDFYDVEQHTWIPGAQEAEYPERAWDKGVNPGGVTFSGGPWVRHGRKIYAYDAASKKIINTKIIYLTAGYESEALKHIQEGEPELINKNDFSQSYHTKWATWVYHEEGEHAWEVLCSGIMGLDLLVQTPHGVMGVNCNWRQAGNKNRPDMSSWKGSPMVDNSVYALNVADRKWQKLTREGPWPQNLYEMTSLVYDSRRNQLILHGGGQERNELWRFPLEKGRWEKIEPGYAKDAGGHPPVSCREAVYLPEDDIFLTVGAPANDRASLAFWAYRVGANSWHKLDIKPPEGRAMNNMMSQDRSWTYDPIHNIVLMVIGQVGDSSSAAVYGMKFNFGK